MSCSYESAPQEEGGFFSQIRLKFQSPCCAIQTSDSSKQLTCRLELQHCLGCLTRLTGHLVPHFDRPNGQMRFQMSRSSPYLEKRRGFLDFVNIPV